MQTKRDFTCWECGTLFKRSPRGEWFCSDCMVDYLNGDITIDVYVSPGDSTTRGYAGYNRGLGVEVKNKEHYDYLVKSQGLRIADAGELAERRTKREQAIAKSRDAGIKKAYEQAVKQAKR